MERITDSRVIKNLLIQSLEKFDQICKQNNLTYSIAFGTLLGAVRHGGFIPWDDDIDVLMPRADYEKLLSLRYNDGRYEVKSTRYSKNYYYIFAKFTDNSTFVEEDNRDGHELGIFIDIFPMDFVSSDYYFKNYDKLDKKTYRIFYFASKFGLNTNRPNSELSFKKIIVKYLHKAVMPISAFVVNSIDKKYISTKGDYCIQFVHNSIGVKCSLKKEEWDNIIPMKFENLTVSAFANYDEILTNLFGDYMTLPPESERKGHPYKAYIR